MKEYEVTVELDENVSKEMCRDWKDIFDNKKEFNKYRKIRAEVEGCHTITTFDEYHELLEKVRFATDGMYHIYNNGTLIMEDE